MTPEERITALERRLAILEKSDRYVFTKHIQMLDGQNFQLSQGTGTKFGTASTQKIGFFGATPVVRQAAPPNPNGGGTTDVACRAAVVQIITDLFNLGLTA